MAENIQYSPRIINEISELFALKDSTLANYQKGADLLHREYSIKLQDGNTIQIDYHSKDKSRVFQMNPDRSVISVKCSRPEYDFRTAWDEKY